MLAKTGVERRRAWETIQELNGALINGNSRKVLISGLFNTVNEWVSIPPKLQQARTSFAGQYVPSQCSSDSEPSQPKKSVFSEEEFIWSPRQTRAKPQTFQLNFRFGFNFSVCARVEQKDKNNKFLLTERNSPIEFVTLISKLQHDQLAIEISYQEVNQLWEIEI